MERFSPKEHQPFDLKPVLPLCFYLNATIRLNFDFGAVAAVAASFFLDVENV
jgi:hypothetical protein